MKVDFINPEVLENLNKNHGEFACVCYDTPKERAENVGAACQKSGHMSGSRCEYIKFHISDIDRGTAEQCMRHEIGTWVPFEMQDNYMWAEARMYGIINENPASIVKNMASFRYIDKGEFSYAVPMAIESNPEALQRYIAIMQQIKDARSDIKSLLQQGGCTMKEAVEAVNMIMPRATTTDLVIGFTPEALIHFCHKRLCSRAQEFIGELAERIKMAVEICNPDFAKRLVPQCEYLLYCPEGKLCCGRKLTREKTENLIDAVVAAAAKEGLFKL
jgi:thymidylate synthase (FAD)